MEEPQTPSPIIRIDHELFRDKGVEVWVKRDDLIHPQIMGNKWRKLKYNLLHAKEMGKNTLFTYGGAFSNHLAAVAAAAKLYGFEAVGIVRGDELNANSNATLKFAASQGMSLQFVSREDYRKLKKQQRADADENAYILPEGGTNQLAVKGVAELVDEITQDFDVIIAPIGTGGTLVGIVQGLKGTKQVIGISSLKGRFVLSEVDDLCRELHVPFHNYEILTEYHFGGYGRFDQDLIGFINIFRRSFGFLIDPIYTGKMFFGVFEEIAKGSFQRGTRLIVIHTGGLQGIEGFNARFGNVLKNT